MNRFACLFFCFIFACVVAQGRGETFPYPGNQELETSDLYQVFANGERIWTERLTPNLDVEAFPDWFKAPYVRASQEVHIANFSCRGEQEVRIELSGPAESVVVRPLSRGIEPDVSGRTVRFTLNGPDYVIVEVDDRPPLFVFADPVEKTRLARDDPNVRFFGPGTHRIGYIELASDETVYLAPGAVVYGGIRASDASNIRIIGRGILDGNFEYGRMVLLERCRNVTVEGITIRQSDSWTNSVFDCRNVVYENVKVLSFGPTGDGISPLGTQGMRISNCFLRCTDDCVAIKTPEPHLIVKDVLVENSTMIGFAYSDGVTIGFETNGKSISDVTVRNCDVLLSRGGSRVDGHSAFSIVCDGPAEIRDILYEDIRVEQAEEKLFELHITDGTKYGIDPPGRIRNVRLKNVSWAREGPIALQGFDEEHKVEDVVFENCTVAGERLTSVGDPAFRVGGYVEGIRFE